METMKGSTRRCVAKIVGTKKETVVIIDDENLGDGSCFVQVISALKDKYR